MLSPSIKILALLPFLMAGCKSTVPDFELVEIDPKVVLLFELKNGSNTLDIGDNFTDTHGFNLTLRTLKFYVSDIDLITGAGTAHRLSDVELVDFDDQKDGKTNTFRQAYTYIIPKGDYTQLRFGLGLPATKNATDPTTQPNDSPLSTLSGMYWDWATMYVFVMLEAGLDTSGDHVADANIAFHTGLDTLFRPECEYAMTFNIPAFAKDTLHVQLDWNALFHQSDTTTAIDLGTAPYFHGNTDTMALEMTRRFTENFTRAISVHP